MADVENREKTAADILFEEYKKLQNESPKERRARRKRQEKELKKISSPEYIDECIYSIEHSRGLDAPMTWYGCMVNENWEQYKKDVGYYRRHPERREESEAYTRMMIALFADVGSEQQEGTYV